jgi:hypothetical protein
MLAQRIETLGVEPRQRIGGVSYQSMKLRMDR